MPVNRDKPDLWKTDINKSVDFYNSWFLKFAPKAFRETRIKTTEQVSEALSWTENMTTISPKILLKYPSILPMLRMTTCPPIARDRLIGLAGISPNLVKSMEIEKKIPPRMNESKLMNELKLIGEIIERMADPDIFVWKKRKDRGTEDEVYRAATIVADRLCGAVADPIIRNAQEQRQLSAIKIWLEARGYKELINTKTEDILSFSPGSFSFRFNVPVKIGDNIKVNIPIDTVIMPMNAKRGDFPMLFEAKSAGDFTNTNKRRKEEAIKIQQLRNTYGSRITLNLFLCGYFDSGYLGYEAAEGIDWVWEHRIDDLKEFGI